MENKTREYSGRIFSSEDISLIESTVLLYPRLSQRELASTICELIGWVTPNGKPKYVQCMKFLRELEYEEQIKLPEVKLVQAKGKRMNTKVPLTNASNDFVDTSEIKECSVVSLEKIRPGKDLQRWRKYIRDYHVLGDPKVLGNQLRYMIKSEGRDLGCLLFSGSSWALEPRESWIGWTSEEKKKHLHLIVNNARFLLLPGVRVKNLASRVLSMASRRLQKDWLEDYCYAPVLLETFVDAPYKGTSYKAANWIYLGETKGRGRNDRHNEYALTKKSIYALPLQPDFRDVLKGLKPCKAVNPDE